MTPAAEAARRLARGTPLGTLAGPARRRFERLLRPDTGCDAGVGAWKERLGGSRARCLPCSRATRVAEAGAASVRFGSGCARAGPLQWLRAALCRALGGGWRACCCVCAAALQPALIGLEPQLDALLRATSVC